MVSYFVDLFTIDTSKDIDLQIDKQINEEYHFSTNFYELYNLEDAITLAEQLLLQDDHCNYATISINRMSAEFNENGELTEPECVDATVIGEIWSDEVAENDTLLN